MYLATELIRKIQVKRPEKNSLQNIPKNSKEVKVYGKTGKNEENYKFEINNLNLHYGDFHALKNINMNIEKNQITAFIGPSGCGKSTFLKTLNRMNDLVTV
mgnify:CR=1 FL=1